MVAFFLWNLSTAHQVLQCFPADQEDAGSNEAGFARTKMKIFVHTKQKKLFNQFVFKCLLTNIFTFINICCYNRLVALQQPACLLQDLKL